MKHILLATTGASPQVLTETLYAIKQSGKPFPDEVYVITTRSTKPMLCEGLFDEGHLEALIREYDLPPFLFNEEHIWLIENDQGERIDDAKTVDDQTYMADYITHKVLELTQDDNVALHASLSGGRKTMAFYFGYAMSMFGRQQDTLSHVFVDDEYEFVRDFWYPTRKENWVPGKNGQPDVDTSQATVTLIEIPYVRMRDSVDPSLIKSMNDLSFSETVGMINASHRDELSVDVNVGKKALSIAGVDIKLGAKELAFYLWLHDHGEKGILIDRYFEDCVDVSIRFLNRYLGVSTDPRVFKTLGTTPEDFKANDYSDLKGMGKDFVQTNISSIRKKLRKVLPPAVASKVEIVSESEGLNQRYWVAAAQETICVIEHD